MGQTVGRGKHRGRSSRLLCRVGARGPGAAESQCTAAHSRLFLTHFGLVQYVEKPLKWAVHQLYPLAGYVDNRVALLGDAVSFHFVKICMAC